MLMMQDFSQILTENENELNLMITILLCYSEWIINHDDMLIFLEIVKKIERTRRDIESIKKMI